MSLSVPPVSAPTSTTAADLSAPAKARRGRRNGRAVDRRLALAIPAGALLLALAVWPLWQLGNMSLHAVSAATLNSQWDFVGLDNYATILDEPDFGQVVV